MRSRRWSRRRARRRGGSRRRPLPPRAAARPSRPEARRGPPPPRRRRKFRRCRRFRRRPPRRGYSWYTEPGVLVTQSHIERSTLDDVRIMAQRIDAVLRLKKAELAKLRGLLIVHDWRSLKTWENGARQLMVERAHERKRG